MKVNILGTDYDVLIQNDNPKIRKIMDECDALDLRQTDLLVKTPRKSRESHEKATR